MKLATFLDSLLQSDNIGLPGSILYEKDQLLNALLILRGI